MAEASHDESGAVNRRARKRELDRRAQRAARERTRNRISVLEATIEAMRAEEPELKASQLMEELTQAKRDRDELASALRSIREITARQLGPFDMNLSGTPLDLQTAGNSQSQSPGHPVAVADAAVTDAETSTLSVEAQAAFDTNSIGHQTSYLSVSPTIEVTDAQVGRVLQADWPNELPMDLSLISPSPVADGNILPEPLAVCDCLYPPATVDDTGSFNTNETSIWRTANRILALDKPFSQSMLRLEDETCEDVPIRAILEGWDSLDTPRLPLLWQKLRQIDFLQFKNCNNVERLAIFIIMHRMLRRRADTSAKDWSSNIPLWLTDRPSQSLPHSAAIDYFAWPGVRERMVFLQHSYCSNHFWKVFAESFKLSWPFEFRDCYQRNSLTGQYCVSPSFESRLHDINCWTMTVDFFYYFPDFRSDIPCSQYVARPHFHNYLTHQESRQRERDYLA